MVILHGAPDQAVQRRRADWRSWLACGLAALSAASWFVALVLPYYAVGRPGADSLYLYEIDAQWPYDSALGPLVGLLALWTLAMAPFVSAAVACWSAHRLWSTRSAHGGHVVVMAALLVSLVTLAWFTTPLAGDLMAWMID